MKGDQKRRAHVSILLSSADFAYKSAHQAILVLIQFCIDASEESQVYIFTHIFESKLSKYGYLLHGKRLKREIFLDEIKFIFMYFFNIITFDLLLMLQIVVGHYPLSSICKCQTQQKALTMCTKGVTLFGGKQSPETDTSRCSTYHYTHPQIQWMLYLIVRKLHRFRL